MKRILILMLAVMFLFGCATVKDVAVDTVKEVGGAAVDSGKAVVESKVDGAKKVVSDIKSDLLNKLTFSKKEVDSLWIAYKPIKDVEKLARESYKAGSEALEGVIKTTENTIAALDAFKSQVFLAEDIKVWKYNNLGSYRIDEFKKLTDYKARMTTIEAMDPSEKKIKYQNNTTKLFTKYKTLLVNAQPNLEKAKELNNKIIKYVEAAGNDTKKYEDRAATIQSNIDYCEWVLKNYTK